MREIKCTRCGRTVMARSWATKYCGPCAREVRLEASRQFRKRQAAQIGRKAPARSVKEVNVEARAHGMSYGQWVAQMEARRGREEAV